jgi:AcrR family transcriptional regulator
VEVGSPSAGEVAIEEHNGVSAAAEPAPMRADARRNRTRLLAAAEAAFAEEGLGVTVDEIARRAGVGAGTLYRNFPTKEHLFQAVIVHHMEALAAQAKALAESDRPGWALFEFLRLLASEAGAKRDLVEALSGAGVNVKESVAPVKAVVSDNAEVLLRRAQAAGEIRPDVTLQDLFGLVVGTCTFAADHPDPRAQARMMAVVCDGLRPGR